ncbi:GNAT family N-acetyltransferase [Brochothrix thermosphacta]|uniref:Putative acetyltransferase (Polyamine degradation) n=1 Tax=Brochothrix thermosphacta TaxID=2756 RepID=A0A2X0SH31_BROTH|nr:GNAT family N-acetyltransferase [Brochothrix thermosphacta]SPP30891.1 putative acetyltransferase (polyamine degradation) [Brochothrix thermosphacta]
MHFIQVTTKEQLQEAFKIRFTVFVDEQGVDAAHELDDFDSLGSTAIHLIFVDNEKTIGAARLRFIDDCAKMERICVLAEYRKGGVGRLIMTGLENIARDKQMTFAKLHGQTQAEGFYNKLGYEKSSDIFFEEGIPHIEMKKTL